MNYDDEDQTLTSDQLDDKYNPEGDGEHPYHTRLLWREAVDQRDTLCGYWDWVEYQIEVDMNQP